MPTSRLILTAACALLAATACGHRSEAVSNTAMHAAPTSASASRGASLFAVNCASCHGAAGEGARIGRALRGERNRADASKVHAIISDPQPPMPKLFPAQLTEQDVNDLTAYVETL